MLMRMIERSFSRIPVTFMIVVVAALGGTATKAQTSPSTGAVQGVVKDSSGAVVPNAMVTLGNSMLGINRQMKTGTDGSFVFPLVQPGTGYAVEVEHAGFQKGEVKDLTVRVTQVTTANVALVVGSSTQEVVVSATPSPVETSNATLGETLGSNVITAIPLPTRDVLDLLATDAGVTATLTSPAATILQGSEAMFVGGSRDSSNNFMVNGVDANNFEFHTLANGIIPVPNPDAVQEFRTETSLYDATTGYSGGGNISLLTRAGTSQYHGTAYEFLRNTDFNANDFFFNAQGQPRPILIQNQFGGSFGGPVPKIDKTFWFFNYEGQRQRNGITGSITGQLPVLPATRTAQTMATLYGLPLNAIDPVAINVLNAPGPYGGLLFPSGTGPVNGELGSFAFSSPIHLDSNQYNGRIDRDFNLGSVVNRLSVSFFANPDTFSNPGGANGTLGQAYHYLLKNETLSVHDTQTIHPDLLNEISVGFTYNKRDIGAINPVTIGQLGITRFNSAILARGPNFSFSDQLNCCGASASVGETQRNESADFRDMTSYVHSSHTFRFGFEARTQQFNFGVPLDPGSLFFSGGIADAKYGPPPCPSNQAPDCNTNMADGPNLLDLSIRDFLVGAPASTGISSGLTDFEFRAHDFGIFGQDDFRLNHKLTLNLGLRWDYLGNITDKHGFISNFDPSRLTPLAAQTGGPGLQDAFVIPSSVKNFGIPGVSKSTMFNQPLKNFSPRLGFAYDVFGNGKMAVRGGFGMYYMRIGGFGTLQTVSNPPFALSTGFAQIPSPTAQSQILANPFPVLPLPSAFPIFTPFPQLTSLNADGSPNFNQPQLFVTEVDRNMRTPYMEQWNLTTQYEFIKDWMIEVGYQGSHGVRLENAQELNNALLRNANNPTALGINSNSAANREARVSFEGINSSGLFALTNSAKSFYDALLVTVSHQFTRGLFFKAAYTFSKSIDNTPTIIGFEPGAGATGNQFIPGLNKGLSDFDVPHRFVMTYVYDIPGPKEGALEQVLSHWSLSGITTLQSGFASEVDQFTFFDSFSGTDGYAALVPGCKLMVGGNVSTHTNNYLNPACAQLTTTLISGQNFGPLSPFEGPGNQIYKVDPNNPNATGQLQGPSTRGAFFDPFETRWDMALTKTFPFPQWGENRNLQFRAEAFKVFNTPIFSGPGAFVPFSSFGKIFSTIDNTGRQLQLALRLNF